MVDQKPTVHLFCGMPCSGKTRLARDIETKQNAVRFTLDEWMIALYDFSIFDEEYGNHAHRVKEMIWETAVRLLNLGTDVILDWSLWNPERRSKWIERAESIGATYKLYYLNIPQSVLHQRLAKRNLNPIPGTHPAPPEELDRFRSIFQPPTDDEALNVIEMHFGHDKPIHNAHLEGDSFLWEGNNTGILLLHGLTATAAEVRLLAERLHQKGYTVAGPLLPGHGTKPEDLNQTTWHDWAWEAEKSYQHLATLCDRVFVGGESTGAVLALDLATKHKDIAGVLCYAPAIKLAFSATALARLYVAAPLVDSIPKSHMGTNPYWQGYRVYPLRAVMELVRLGRDVRNRLNTIQQPILVIQGQNDETIAPNSSEIILDNVASKTKEGHWLENSGHVILLEDELDTIESLTLQFVA
ncbi:MAG: alpha/beta fold hydrolase [Chloroflexi bacterium]|nr:MAG: alpha/beta fold hydrolase [Chloroflexota bacterium]